MNQNNINYQKEFEKVINNLSDGEESPKLLLHSCCAPCSSYCLIYLRDYFDITSYFYNPNITGVAEYEHRLVELKRLAEILNENRVCEKRGEEKSDEFRSASDRATNSELSTCDIKVIGAEFDSGNFYDAVKGLEDVPEGGARCAKCFSLRLEKTAKVASEMGFDYFSTTLTISPLKNAALLNQIGYAMGEKYGVKWLPSDFKKKGGYQESIRLSKEYDLYRQDFCGCEFSRRRDYKPE